VRPHRALVQGRPGFRATARSSRSRATVGVGVFHDKDPAMDAHRRVRERVEANMRDPHARSAGGHGWVTVFHEVAPPREQTKDRQQPLFAVIPGYEGITGLTRTMHWAAARARLLRPGTLRSQAGWSYETELFPARRPQ
jgi:hypothetical protein